MQDNLQVGSSENEGVVAVPQGNPQNGSRP